MYPGYSATSLTSYMTDWSTLVYSGESVLDMKLNWKLANDTFGRPTSRTAQEHARPDLLRRQPVLRNEWAKSSFRVRLAHDRSDS